MNFKPETAAHACRTTRADGRAETLTIEQYLYQNNPTVVQLHLGCGGKKLPNYINIDQYPAIRNEVDSSRNGCDPDCLGDMKNLGLENLSVDSIFTSHTIDHFTRWDCIRMVRDWHRMLRMGGRCEIEVADFDKCVLWLFHPSKKKRELARTQFYGNQWDEIEYETHRYLWSGKELKKVLLEEIGFSSVSLSHRKSSHVPGRDMYVCATK